MESQRIDPKGALKVKYSTNVLKDKNSPAELVAIQILNSDLNRRYPDIDHRPAIGRGRIVRAALTRCANPFQLCSNTSRIVRMVHNSNSSRFAASITWALQKIAEPPAKYPAVVFLQAERLAG